MKKSNKYPNGFKAKLSYWNGMLSDAKASNDTVGIARCESKLEYFTKRQNELDARVPQFISTEDVTDTKSKYSEAVRKSVKVLNAPMGFMADKQDFITKKLVSEGFTKEEASTVFLEALNIASDGELLRSV